MSDKDAELGAVAQVVGSLDAMLERLGAAAENIGRIHNGLESAVRAKDEEEREMAENLWTAMTQTLSTQHELYGAVLEALEATAYLVEQFKKSFKERWSKNRP